MGLQWQAKGWADQRVVMYTVDTGDIWPNRSRQIRIVQKRPQPERAETAISSDSAVYGIRYLTRLRGFAGETADFEIF